MADSGKTFHLGDLTPDPRNARRHTPRNVGLIEQALQEVGAARSIVIDEDGAGHATVEAAAQAGIDIPPLFPPPERQKRPPMARNGTARAEPRRRR